MIEFIWYFFIYAFLGWCTEVCFAAVTTGKFVNRGFLNGPLCPMYGVGVVMIVFCLTPIKDNPLPLFAGAVVLTTVLEGLTGFLLEKLFHQRWWDYSDTPFNLGGYVCLKFSLMWGLACLLIMDVLHPFITMLVQHIHLWVSAVVLPLLGVLMICDLVFTVLSVRNLNLHLEQLARINARIRDTSDGIGEKMSDAALALVNHQRDLIQHLRGGEKRLLRAFPGMRSLRHPEWLEKMKEQVNQIKKK